MKKIMMTKYGFVRWPEEDFSDDGSRFYAYRVGERVRVTKCVFDGQAYIDATIHGTKLPYEVYSKLPHYPMLGKLNGVATEFLTDDDLFELLAACIQYEKEYIDAENNFKMPSLSEIKVQCMNVQAKRVEEFEEIEQLLSRYATKLAMELAGWQWKTFKEYLVKLAAQRAQYNPEVFAPTILGNSTSVRFCKPDCSELGNSYYYNYLMDLIKSVQGE